MFAQGLLIVVILALLYFGHTTQIGAGVMIAGIVLTYFLEPHIAEFTEKKLTIDNML